MLRHNYFTTILSHFYRGSDQNPLFFLANGMVIHYGFTCLCCK